MSNQKNPEDFEGFTRTSLSINIFVILYVVAGRSHDREQKSGWIDVMADQKDREKG